MSGTIVVSSCCTHEVAHRPIDGNGIAGRLNAAKTKVTLGVCHKFSPQIHCCLLGILLLVDPFRRGMPDVDFSTIDRLTALVLDPAIDEHRWPWCRGSHDGATILCAR